MDIRACNGWGERNPPVKELSIPNFMLPDYIDREQQHKDELECAAAAAKGRERRKLRKKARQERNYRIGVAIVPTLTFLLAVIEMLIK